MLSLDERNDLRKRVLQGYQLTIEEAREVFETLRQNRVVDALIASEVKPKKGRKKETLSDAALDADLAGLGL